MGGEAQSAWQIFVDTGGTFTDCLGVSPEGELKRTKVLSNGALRAKVIRVTGSTLKLAAPWSLVDDFFVGFTVYPSGAPEQAYSIVAYSAEEKIITLGAEAHAHFKVGDLLELASGEEPPVLAARVLTLTPRNQPLPELVMRLGTTRGTNALLEKKGERIAFITTKGFEDLLRIGNQQRPDLFVLDIQKPEPLYACVHGVAERISTEGAIIQNIDDAEAEIKAMAQQLVQAGYRVAAVCLLNSFVNSVHEKRVEALFIEAGFDLVVCSSTIASKIKLLPRAQTTVVDAYLAPILNAYLDSVSSALHNNPLFVMTSAGGLVPRNSYRPKDSLLSGPAGGVVGAVNVGLSLGEQRIIAFDMGGTSTDVSRYEGVYDYQYQHRVGDAEIVAPALKIETVAAGGGSICSFKGQTLSVGPESAGADPGPACYGAGGPLTITDVNLLLGHLSPEGFSIPIDMAAAEKALDAIVVQTGQEADVILQGFLDIANERMADAIRKISVREGYDPKDYALVAFGGAGGLHACAIADKLGMRRVLFANDAGLLSAYGISRASVERFAEKEILRPLAEVCDGLETDLDALLDDAQAQLVAEGFSQERIRGQCKTAQLRVSGQDAVLNIEFESAQTLEAMFHEKYASIFGYSLKGKTLELVSLNVVAVIPAADAAPERLEQSNVHAITVFENQIQSYFERQWRTVPFIKRCDLEIASRLKGPAVIADDYSALVVESGWSCTVGEQGTLVLDKAEASAQTTEQHAEVVAVELFMHRFLNIVEEMGLQLQRTALSTNVKERLDFSCALLDAGGKLVANAPHIPVHLGALGLCVRKVAETLSLEPGDVVVTNHPAFGGSHLPDVTVITPVFEPTSKRLMGYVANRAHHAEIGGKLPGSMPPNAQNLAEEGVVLAPMYLFRKGESCFDAVEQALLAKPYPSRSVEENLADLHGQVAANLRGRDLLLNLVDKCGCDTVEQAMEALCRKAARIVSEAMAPYSGAVREAVEFLDDGAQISVRVSCEKEKWCIDFSGTSAVLSNNLNATPAIVQSAVLYVLRLMVGEKIPLNEGLVESIEIVLPPCFLNPDFSLGPEQSPAVVGGNVEASQRIVDTLIKAFELSACSQGTMNNLVFGNDAVSYYETIAGGAGAGNGFAGASAVHTHMTNTAITDPEIFERRYPVRLKQFSVRRGSGGQGLYPGGDGVVREIEFLKTMSVSLLTQHRKEQPYGLEGGQPGQCGEQSWLKADGGIVQLPSIAHVEVNPNDVIVISTPGGGGWGLASSM